MACSQLSSLSPYAIVQTTSTISAIQTAVARAYGLSLERIMQPYGPPQAREARMLVCYLAREITQETYPRIGSLLGYADHTTALYGHKRITKLLAKNPTSAAVVAKLRASLTPGGVYGDAAIF